MESINILDAVLVSTNILDAVMVSTNILDAVLVSTNILDAVMRSSCPSMCAQLQAQEFLRPCGFAMSTTIQNTQRNGANTVYSHDKTEAEYSQHSQHGKQGFEKMFQHMQSRLTACEFR